MTSTAFVPRYVAIEHELRARIARMQPGDALPSDSELCEEFGVSRMTARNAVHQLKLEGLVERVPGRGTFRLQAAARCRPNRPRRATPSCSASAAARRSSSSAA